MLRFKTPKEKVETDDLIDSDEQEKIIKELVKKNAQLSSNFRVFFFLASLAFTIIYLYCAAVALIIPWEFAFYEEFETFLGESGYWLIFFVEAISAAGMLTRGLAFFQRSNGQGDSLHVFSFTAAFVPLLFWFILGLRLFRWQWSLLWLGGGNMAFTFITDQFEESFDVFETEIDWVKKNMYEYKKA
eukprot:GCRY01002683.1.p1 GENE.GCRY01002683.1~~GCRY01002683.1.p1  ORF type:complete len:187 (-),score=20.36 GCRY01002683.1:30-590(-)